VICTPLTRLAEAGGSLNTNTSSYSAHRRPLACGHDAGRKDEQDGLIGSEGPPYSRIHSGRKPAIGIQDVEFHWHRSGLRIDRMSASAKGW
jgi:hypothetical protein